MEEKKFYPGEFVNSPKGLEKVVNEMKEILDEQNISYSLENFVFIFPES